MHETPMPYGDNPDELARWVVWGTMPGAFDDQASAHQDLYWRVRRAIAVSVQCALENHRLEDATPVSIMDTIKSSGSRMNDISRVLRSIARNLVLLYFQSWGQSLADRMHALNQAMSAIGLKARMEMFGEGQYSLQGDDKARASQFIAELRECFPKGRFQDEEDAIAMLLKKWCDESRA